VYLETPVRKTASSVDDGKSINLLHITAPVPDPTAQVSEVFTSNFHFLASGRLPI
jgi:hypothetical protein